MASSTSAASSSATLNPPRGWSVDPDDLDVDQYWKDTNAPGKVVLAQYHLQEPTVEMCTVPESPTPLYMFSSGGQRYLWNMMDGAVWKVKTEGSAQAIADQIGTKGIGSLEIERP